MANKKSKKRIPKKILKKPIAKKKIETVMEEFKKGELPIGKSKKKVKKRKQAIAISLSEAEEAVKRGSIKKPVKSKSNGNKK